MTAPPLQLELLNPGSLALCRAYNTAYPDSYWEPPPPAARTARVDPPAGHQDDFAILYLGVHVAATAAEARLLQQDVRRQWFISRDSAKHYALATYTLAKPAVLLPIDGPNQAGLGLDPVTMAFEDDYASSRAMALRIHQQFDGRIDGFTWESFRAERIGRVVALFHHRKAYVGLQVLTTKPHPPLLDSPEWQAFETQYPGIEIRDA
jgi:hypothetical protein